MKILSTSITAAAVGALLLAGASPASAAGASIDPGDSLYAINCDSVYNDWQLLGVEASTAASVPIGDGTGSVDEDLDACAFQAAYDVTTGKSYYIQVTDDEENETVYSLASIDVVTGDSTTIGEFYFPAEVTTYPEVESIAIGIDGKAYAFADSVLYGLDLTNAKLTFIDDSLNSIDSFAVDPTTGIFYAIDTNANQLFVVDVTDGDWTFPGAVVFPLGETYVVHSLQIDQSGRFWIEVDRGREQTATLWSFTLSTLASPVYSGDLDDDPYYSESLLLIPGAALPATGPEVGAAPIVAGLIVLIGGALILLRRRSAAMTH